MENNDEKALREAAIRESADYKMITEGSFDVFGQWIGPHDDATLAKGIEDTKNAIDSGRIPNEYFAEFQSFLDALNLVKLEREMKPKNPEGTIL